MKRMDRVALRLERIGIDDKCPHHSYPRSEMVYALPPCGKIFLSLISREGTAAPPSLCATWPDITAVERGRGAACAPLVWLLRRVRLMRNTDDDTVRARTIGRNQAVDFVSRGRPSRSVVFQVCLDVPVELTRSCERGRKEILPLAKARVAPGRTEHPPPMSALPF